MNNKQYRKYLMHRYGQLYRRVSGLDLTRCAYCGDPREVLDHVPAISLLDGIDVKEYIKKGGKLLLYPACLMCNKLLKNHESVSYADRLDYLSYRYNQRLSKLEPWSRHELNQMGKNMRAYIEAHQYKIKLLMEKLNKIENRRLNGDYDDQD